MEKERLFSGKKVKIGPDSGYDNYIMAIESSCDETACAIVKNGREVISNIVASQIKTHEKFGGVIPEIAAREHLDAINIICRNGRTGTCRLFTCRVKCNKNFSFSP